MENVISEAQLKNKIAALEAKQERELEELKAQFKVTYNNMQPLNLIKSTIHDVIKAPDVQGDIMNAGVSLIAGYVAKKIAFGKQDGVIKNILGDLFQLGITTTVAKHPDEIKTAVKKLVSMAWSVQQAGSDIADNSGLKKKLMKEIMQLTAFIQTAHPQLYRILEETPTPEVGPGNEISIKSLKSYRDSLKLQLMQFGDKQPV